ncbi:MAG: hypothetical protein GYB67_15230, partial [Chloroflexi bacterium]|nr:hypothetical protein [Chloroflexota bacterium]
IIPGETTWRDALTILEDDTSLANIEQQQSEESGAVAIEWARADGAPCCQLGSEDGDVVNFIFLRTTPDISFGEAIDVIGFPSYLVGTPFSEDQAIMNLIYPNIPLVLYVFVAGETGDIQRASEIIGILYLTEDDMERLLDTAEPGLHVWEGFESYQYYDEGEFEITPIPTITPAEDGE